MYSQFMMHGQKNIKLNTMGFGVIPLTLLHVKELARLMYA